MLSKQVTLMGLKVSLVEKAVKSIQQTGIYTAQ